jgi:hypothetical protein
VYTVHSVAILAAGWAGEGEVNLGRRVVHRSACSRLSSSTSSPRNVTLILSATLPHAARISSQIKVTDRSTRPEQSPYPRFGAKMSRNTHASGPFG